ncbi:MAG: hypothetical protein ACYC0L_01200 [Thermoleophilia bacterium]
MVKDYEVIVEINESIKGRLEKLEYGTTDRNNLERQIYSAEELSCLEKGVQYFQNANTYGSNFSKMRKKSKKLGIPTDAFEFGLTSPEKYYTYALDASIKCTRLNPRNMDAWELKAECEKRLDHLSDSKLSYQQAIALRKARNEDLRSAAPAIGEDSINFLGKILGNAFGKLRNRK